MTQKDPEPTGRHARRSEWSSAFPGPVARDCPTLSLAEFEGEVAVHRKAWTACSVALLVLGVALFETRPQEVTYVFTSRLHGSEATGVGDPQVPSGLYWLPPRALLGVAVFVVGLVLLAATTAYAAGLRKNGSAAK
jgi:hypothetical protein